MCWNIHGMNGHGRKQKGEKEKVEDCQWKTQRRVNTVL